MQRREKSLVVCKCGRQLEGKFWIVPHMDLRKWVRVLARRSFNRKINVEVKKCLFCQGVLKERPRPITEAW
jgi:hypothetical protein